MYDLVISAPAKINLTLDVLGKRPDGYHEVEMIMQSIDLRDYLMFRQLPGGFELSCNQPALPVDESNLVTRAVKLLHQRHPWTGGVAIHLEKNIPLAAGLGGGSADAAAALKGINELFELGLSLEELISIAAELGADIPFCLLEGTAVARGKGEILMSLTTPKPIWLVLVKPSVAVSTAKVYQGFRPERVKRRPQTAEMIQALQAGDLDRICANLVNVLETVTLDWYPEIGQIKDDLLVRGALGALMSGSGPTVFGVVADRAQAEHLARQFQSRYAEVFAVATI
ncbi:MAG: 4-(cytidine 5'-diphospho)-2-C-methyl-D-erythritol kinase [Firmicutes bacterium]|nr:4-(cytidine 5'-diphospho)-2-C-methyl-D-erythritol kinase [Bacillota bacterium]